MGNLTRGSAKLYRSFAYHASDMVSKEGKEGDMMISGRCRMRKERRESRKG